MNSTFGYDARLARALLFAGVAGIASLCGSQLGNAAPTKSPHAANDYAAIFPRKADLSGNLLPSKIGVFKLDASREIEIPVQIPSVCFFGDRDVLFLEAGWGKFEEVLVSIEPLDPSGGKGSSTRVKVEELGSGSARVRLKVPASSRPTPMGLFICKDEKRQGSCRNKKLVEIEATLKKFHDPAKPENLDPKKDFPEIVYFFAHITVSPDSVSWIESQFTQEERSRMRALIDEAVPRERAKRAKERLDALQKTLNSAPLAEVDGKPVIALPGLNPAGCPTG